ncbi:RNA-binding protein 12B [Acipenser ruthenus]|uniref:RNA-binding protein 12B n=1 Tax=Acipenser ruthenus TaxID=7906 RepID=A0A444TVT7_ACIRT|nr:RNA-binding protein 12B [Acipenser ruthenus]
MAVVIRLQGLKITAGSEDIRSFFTGLTIPDGGVHIIGGELEEAFIIFATDEDARRAMTRSEGCIKGSPVHLLLSSKSDMQNTLEASRKKPGCTDGEITDERPGVRRPKTRNLPTTFARDLVAEIRRMKHSKLTSGLQDSGYVDIDPDDRLLASKLNCDGYYLYLRGMPFSATEDDVRMFFKGLGVEEIILLKNRRGQPNGDGIVKFATQQDACEGLERDRAYIGTRFVEVNASTENEWIAAGGNIRPSEEVLYDRPRGMSPVYVKSYSEDRSRSRSPIREQPDCLAPSEEEHYVLVENLSHSNDKRDIKKFFQHAVLDDDQILWLHDKYGGKTREAFVLFKKLRDYCSALDRKKGRLGDRTIYVSPISKKKMVEMISAEKQKLDVYHERSVKLQEKKQHSSSQDYSSPRTCIYVRNLPFDVQKEELKSFFAGFWLAEDCIHLLYDEKGVGLGEALVKFKSEKWAINAERLNRRQFLGHEVLLRRITREQMQEFGVEDHLVTEEQRDNSPPRYIGSNEESFFPYGGEVSAPALSVPSETIPPPMQDLTFGPNTGNNGLYQAMDNAGSFWDGGQGTMLNANGSGGFGECDGPTCVKLMNLPFQINLNEIYDFCYGYRVIPGSVSLQFNKKGFPKGTATVVFETHEEAQSAVKELNSRPIGTRKIRLDFL